MYEAAPAGDAAWRRLLTTILERGERVAPRGQPTLEILHVNQLRVDLARPVVTSPARKLNYRFMAAEALWVQSGSNELAPLTRFVKRMAEFSDDGQTLAGAYGPPIVNQLPYVVDALIGDRDTRQAVLTIWKPSPPRSKDIPCTVAMVFSVRDYALHQHVFMRSSDAWLGVPYDMFTFACVGLRVACEVNRRAPRGEFGVYPGALTISMTSSHLYERDLEQARAVLASPAPVEVDRLPYDQVADGRWDLIEHAVETLRERRAPTDEDWPLWKLGGEHG